MSFLHWISVAAVAIAPLAASAQQAQQASPDDAHATVPATVYVSAFETYRPAPSGTATPDQVWRAANKQVAGEDMHGGAMTRPAADAAGPAPNSGDAPADPHAGHHTMQGH